MADHAPESSVSCGDAVKELSQLLLDTAQGLAQIAPAIYVTADIVGSSSTIGAHVRHSLDHVRALLLGVPERRIDYDQRDRGTQVEADHALALAMLRNYRDDLQALAALPASYHLVSMLQLSPAAAPIPLQSTLARELAFVLSHTIHHNAMIMMLARAQGIELPRYFGIAPSTVAWLQQQ